MEELNIIEDIFGSKGTLVSNMQGFIARPQQAMLADEILQALINNTNLVVEAGTGMGKTLSYLVPCLLLNKKTIVSTATKTLQDQLFLKDLPMLINALKLSVRVQNLKGRSNYICFYRTNIHAEEGHNLPLSSESDLYYVRDNLPRLTEGLRSELPELSEDSPVWPYVTSTTENCLNADCAYYRDCFLIKARQKALKADLIVINHHLFFADGNLKSEGFGELLPKVEVVVFDEAHQLAEIATNFQDSRVSSRQLRYLMNDILQEWPILDLPNQPLKQYALDLEDYLSALFLSVEKYPDRIEKQVIVRSQEFKTAINKLLLWFDSIKNVFDSIDEESYPGLEKCKVRLLALDDLIKSFLITNNANILWIEKFKQNLVFHFTPIDIKKEFQNLITSLNATCIFTSATLTIGNSFESFLQPLGLSNINKLSFASPFDFQQQALLYLPRGLPDPNNVDYEDRLLDRSLPIIKACNGRCFILFTSYRALYIVAKKLKAKTSHPLFIQGDEAKSILLARFRESGNGILLGTSTFWEGVDVKGSALSCVIIDRLPFLSPVDPIVRGKSAYIKSKGGIPFEELSLPHTILALKQGVGRLIRDVSDYGVLMIADPRLITRHYGELIFNSLPAMKKTREEKNVLDFIEKYLNNY